MQYILLAFIYGIVFCTGASGLIFQVTWHKYISRLLGSDSIATAIILAAFLGGLSVGYYLCGKISSRVKNHVKAYAFLEGIIGVWCLFFPSIFAAVDRLTESWSFSQPFGMLLQGGLCAALLMGIPTICMGGTIPLLTRGISRNIGEATHIHAMIYSVNTAGAFVGTLVAGFYLIPEFGMPVTIMSTAFINIGASLCFYFLSGVLRTVQATDVPLSAREIRIQPGTPPFPAWILYATAFLSGFYVMTLENVLIRVTSISVGGSSYSFSLIVAVFILAIAIGSYIVGQWREIPRSALFVNQAVIACLLVLIYLSLDSWPYWAHVIRIAFQSNMVGFWAYYAAIFAGLSLLLLVPVAFMGATIPLTFHELKRDLQHVGSHSGFLFSWNTLGNLTGSLVGGMLLFLVLNIPRIFLTAAVFAACSACLVGGHLSKKLGAATGLLAVGLAGLMISTPCYDQQHFALGTFRVRSPFLFSLKGTRAFFANFLQGTRIRFYLDEPTCSVAVIESDKLPAFQAVPLAVTVNGKSDSSTIGDAYTLRLSAHLPGLLARSRENILVIGLGTGVTAAEFTLYPDMKQLDIAEISSGVIRALPYFHDSIHQLETDPRAKIHHLDAFRILKRSKQKWDIVVSEPSNLWGTGVDLLFTQEFYHLVKEHLTEAGILAQWTQLYDANPSMLGMVMNTLHQEFTYCRVFLTQDGDLLTLASNTQISHDDLLQAEQRFQNNPQVRASLREIDMNAFESLLLREIWTPSFTAQNFSEYDLQTMDIPRLHYIAGKEFFQGHDLSVLNLFLAPTAKYWSEYLLVRRFPDWQQISAPNDLFEAMRPSVKNKISQTTYPSYWALTLKMHLSNPEKFPLSEREKLGFQFQLLPLIMNAGQTEEMWNSVGLASASFREKAAKMLEHTQKFRNWVVPYPIAGLEAVLKDGMMNGRDEYEKNWCLLQLVKLLAEQGGKEQEALQLLAQAKKDANGNILLNNQDAWVIQAIAKAMSQKSALIEGGNQ